LKTVNDDQMKLVVCAPQEQKPKVLESFLQQLKGKSVLTRIDAEKISDVFTHISEETGTLALVSIQTKEELPEVLQLLMALEAKISSGTVKVVVFNQVNNEKVIPLLRSKGVSEVLELNVSLKAFQYKFNKVVQLLEQSIKRSKDNPKVRSSDKQGSSNSNQSKRQVGQVIYSDPIEHFSDFWLLMNQKNVRFVIGKWFVNFYGPGPNSGTWDSYPEKKNGEQGWIWNPRKTDDQTFYKDHGRWVFFGNCPEFSWEEKHWYFISKSPELTFYAHQEVVHSKIKTMENGDIVFCQNSKNAKNLQGLILDSIEASVRLNDTTKVKKAQDETFEKEKKKNAANFVDEKEENHEYKGRFSEQFEERKKKYTKSYDCSELSLELATKNGETIHSIIRIELVELRDQYVVLDVPAGILSLDDQIELIAKIVENGIEKKLNINTSIQIVEIETEDQRSVVIAESGEENSAQFKELMKAFQDRRDEMNRFFSKAKGVA